MPCLTPVRTLWGTATVETTSLGVLSVRFGDAAVAPFKTLSDDVVSLAHGVAAAGELSDYFDGRLTRFSVPVDLSWAGPFLQDIFRTLMTVPFGHTISYAQLAEAADRPGCARAAGGAMAKNRALIFVPCHRVISADGRLGGWSGPNGFKHRLLAHEGNRPKQ
jgi:O-6-methylguanine DNA methyltransferase